MPSRSGSIQSNCAHASDTQAITSSKSTLPQPVPGSLSHSGKRIERPHCSLYPALPRGLQYSTPNPAAAWSWKSSRNRLPYCVNGPPCTFSSVGYLVPGVTPAGGIAQHSTSLPSADRAMNRCGDPRLMASANGFVRLVSVTSCVPIGSLACASDALDGSGFTTSSPWLVGVATTYARVSAVQCHSLTHWSPPTTSAGARVPSACTWYRCTLPLSSTPNRRRSPIQVGPAMMPNGAQLRSSLVVSSRLCLDAMSTTPTCRWRGFSSGDGLT